MSKKEDNSSSFWLLGGLAVLGIGAAVLLGGNSSTQQDTTSLGGGGSAGGMGGDVVTDMPGVSGGVQYPSQGQQQPIVQYIPQYYQVPIYGEQPQVPNYKAMEAYEAGLQLADSLNTDANNFAEQGIIPTDVHYSYAENLGGGVAYATGTLTEEAQQRYVENLANPTPAPVKPQGTISFASGESYFAFVNPNDISQVYIAKKQTTSDSPSRSSSKAASDSTTDGWSGGGGGLKSGVSASGSLSGGGSFVDV